MLGVRDMIVCRRDESAPLCFFPSYEQALECATSLSLRCLFEIYDSLSDAILQIRQNANVNTVITSLSAKLSHTT